MKISLPLSLGLCIALSSAHKFTVKKVPTAQPIQRRSLLDSPSGLQLSVDAAEANSFDLNTVHDLIYIANITVGGVDYPVQLDTGSSDLFLKGVPFPLPGTTTTPLTYNLTYAKGWASGNVSYAPVEFVGIKIPSQALIETTAVANPALQYGALGIAGMGFNLLSTIDALVNTTNSETGRSLLYNLFAANPSEPNFIAFALQRSTEPDDDVEGSFSIGEFEPDYSHITGNEPISTWPVNSPARWNVLVDAVIVNNSITVPTTSVPQAPSNKAVALMDSGSSYTYASKEVCDAIYGGVPGAAYDATLGAWRVPCDAEIDMALQIGGQVFPIHPLDVNPTYAADTTICIGSFIPGAVFATDNKYAFDWLVGDNFLRSVYSVYDFGDFDSNGVMGNPYMKFLSIIDSDEASIEFTQLRGGTPRTNITFTGLNGISVAPSFSISTDISESLEMIGKFIPAMLAIVALNAVILIVCCIVWLVSFMRKRRSRDTRNARNPRSRMSPMPLNPRNSYIAGAPPSAGVQAHIYTPVSMALTEDTFVPPSPAFHKFDGSRLSPGMSPGDRPKSVA